jgi:hypothetical protein
MQLCILGAPHDLKLILACTDEVHSFTASYEYVHAKEEVPHISAYEC